MDKDIEIEVVSVKESTKIKIAGLSVVLISGVFILWGCFSILVASFLILKSTQGEVTAFETSYGLYATDKSHIEYKIKYYVKEQDYCYYGRTLLKHKVTDKVKAHYCVYEPRIVFFDMGVIRLLLFLGTIIGAWITVWGRYKLNKVWLQD